MESTFHNDELLPPLPVPSLEDSCRKYLKSVDMFALRSACDLVRKIVDEIQTKVQPHVSPEELRKTTFIVNMFVTGEGKRLQEQLKERGRQMKNWLEEWWEAAAYLTVRTPIAVLSNFGGPSWLESEWPPLMGSRCERAAQWIYVGVEFYQLLQDEKVLPQAHAGRYLSMNEFRRLFACTRMPSPSMDRLHTHFRTMSEGPSPSHVIVTCNGHLYCLYVIHEDQTMLSTSELKQQLSWIETHSQSIGKGPGVCALTSTNRDVWAENWKHLADISSNNREILDLIDRALFCLAFSDTTSGTHEQNVHQGVCGDPCNFWFDKCVSLFFNADGTFGNNVEHSPADALITLTLFHYLDNQLEQLAWQFKPSEVMRDLPHPQHLQFDLNPQLYGAIERAVKEHQLLASNLDVKVIDSDIYSKSKAKLFHIRADSTVQLALQLTYRKLHNANAPTYETASTRRFYHGRTETIRSCTPESVEWTKAMLSPHHGKQERLALLTRAANAHVRMLKECQDGNGFDRHLLGLQILAYKEGIAMPAIFTDKSWKASGGGGSFVLSTSSVGGTKFCGGFAPMVEHGYGVCYTILPDRFRCVVTAWKSCPHTNVSAFQKELVQSLREIKNLLSSQPKAHL